MAGLGVQYLLDTRLGKLGAGLQAEPGRCFRAKLDGCSVGQAHDQGAPARLTLYADDGSERAGHLREERPEV